MKEYLASDGADGVASKLKGPLKSSHAERKGVVPALDGKIYLVNINETHYWGSFYGTCIGVKNTLLNKLKKPVHAE